MPTAYLIVSLLGAAFTLNAYRPRDRRSRFVVPSFFAAWLTDELAGQHLAWQMTTTVVFAFAGAFASWPGWLGLAVSVASWIGLAGLLVRAARTGAVVDAALTAEEDSLEHRDAGEPPGTGITVRTSRAQLVFAFPVGDRGLEVDRDIEYAPGAGRRHRLDVYRLPSSAPEAPARDTPATPARGAPVLLQIHGGAWIIGNKRQQARPLLHQLARAGWVCVAPNYQLSPKATFPDHLVDVKLALRWLRTHITEYGGDPDFVVVTGGSAGGHLAAMAALTAGDPAYQPGFETVDTSVRACVPFYGVYDLTTGFGRGPDGMGGFVERMVLKKQLAAEPDAFAAASPIRLVRADAPPFMVVHGTHDSLVPVQEARAFVAALRGVSRAPVVYLELPGAEHAFEVFHSVRTELVLRGVGRFLAREHAHYLGTGPTGTSGSTAGAGT